MDLLLYFNTLNPNLCWTYIGPTLASKAGRPSHKGQPRLVRARNGRVTHRVISKDSLSMLPIHFDGKKRSWMRVLFALFRPTETTTNLVIAPGVTCGHRPSLDASWPIACCNPFHATLCRPGGAPRVFSKNAQKKLQDSGWREVFRLGITTPQQVKPDDYEEFFELLLSYQSNSSIPNPNDFIELAETYPDPAYVRFALKAPETLNQAFIEALRKLVP